jgi:hypothetical protein
VAEGGGEAGQGAGREPLAAEFARLRASKGVTLEVARDLLTDVSYFGTLMVALRHVEALTTFFHDWEPTARALLAATSPAAIHRRDTCDRPPLRHWGRTGSRCSAMRRTP